MGGDEFSSYAILILASALGGMVLGILLRELKPDWCKRYAKYSSHRPWKILLLGTVMFSVFSVGTFVSGQPYAGLFFAAFAVMELVALVGWGFKALSPEKEKSIDDGDCLPGAFGFRRFSLRTLVVLLCLITSATGWVLHAQRLTYQDPARWWGILLLIEFWATLAFSGLLIWSVMRDRKQFKKHDGGKFTE